MERRIRNILALGIAFCCSLPTIAEAQKPVVGVAAIETAAQNISCEGWRIRYDCNRDLAEGFRMMLETAIFESGKMDIMERARLDGVLAEQLMGEAGLTTSGGQVGGLTGIDYLIYGTVTKFGAGESGLSANVGSVFGGIARRAGTVQKTNVTTEMAVDLRVTDVATGQVVFGGNVEASVTQGSGFAIGGIRSVESSADPFADVQRVAAAKISEAVVTSRIPIKVIQVQNDGTLILNYGSVFLAPGDQLVAFQVGESFVDPDTGEILGAEETELGMVQVTQAEDKFSRARVVSASGEISAGDTLKKVLCP